MKAAAFDHVRASSLPHAVALLAQHGDDARVIAGGQSLVPALNLRLLAPALLVDIGGLEELRGIALADGVLRIGALTRHIDLLRSAEVAAHAPLIAQAMVHVAHPAIRNRGTIGGSLANADPAAELPACVVALRARLVAAGPGGERRIPADAFFKGLYETALAPGEILTAVEIDAIRPDERSAFGEIVRRSGDYALVGLAAHAALAPNGSGLRDLHLVYLSVGTRPVPAPRTAAALVGRPAQSGLADARAALAEDLRPVRGDIHASAETRLQLACVLLRRALGDLGALGGAA